jgi:hypothetical protein
VYILEIDYYMITHVITSLNPPLALAALVTNLNLHPEIEHVTVSVYLMIEVSFEYSCKSKNALVLMCGVGRAGVESMKLISRHQELRRET